MLPDEVLSGSGPRRELDVVHQHSVLPPSEVVVVDVLQDAWVVEELRDHLFERRQARGNGVPCEGDLWVEGPGAVRCDTM